MNNHEYPKLRLIEALPAQVSGKHCFVLRDQQGVAQNDLVVPMEAAFLLTMLDGSNTVLDIKTEFVRRTGLSMNTDHVDSFLDTLDKNLMLDNNRYLQAKQELEKAFRESPTRSASHAGSAYPADSRELIEFLTNFYQHEKGPKALPVPKQDSRPVLGLVAPHIDLKAGGPSFAWAYHALAQGPAPDRFVILGTGHQGTENAFVLTGKDFETPLGVAKTDKQFVERLNSNGPADYTKDEILHKTEHVIEFQVVFLQHLYGASAPFTIVPILCSFDPEYFFHRELDSRAHLVKHFAERLRQVILDSPGRTCLIASVDLDHIGRRYGDQFEPDQSLIERNLKADRELLTWAEQGNDVEFLNLARTMNPRHRICGFSPLYTMLRTGLLGKGRIMSLDYATVDNANSFVSFAAMVFTDEK